MGKPIPSALIAALAMVTMLSSGAVRADAFEDGAAAYKNGDYATALRAFRKAAQHGNPKAQSNLGMMYAIGEGVFENNVRAQMWFIIAARNGDPVARIRRDVMEKRLYPFEISQAKELARAWLEKHRQQ